MTSRRGFLHAGMSALAATALPVSLRRRAQAPQRILVAGAGIAGLVAAYELERAGHDVLVVEAKSIPGGRIRTIRAPFADGLYAEAGAILDVSAKTVMRRWQTACLRLHDAVGGRLPGL